MADVSHTVARTRGIRRVVHNLQVAFALEDGGPATARTRALTFALLVAFVYAALGTLQFAKPPKLLAKPPFDLDIALRVVALGWFDSDRTIPVTIVDIDEQTHASWNAPVFTPRTELRNILEEIASASPTAIVVDIDLAHGGHSFDQMASQGEKPLLEYLDHYDQKPPLIFPKRVEAGPAGKRRIVASPYDALIQQNPRLSWAHADLQAEKGGVVRWSQFQLPTCAAGQQGWLPSIALRVSTLLGGSAQQQSSKLVSTVITGAPCNQTDTMHGARFRLLVGPRITGTGRLAGSHDALSIPARMLQEPAVSHVDPRLFFGRVVLIGASHSAAGDNWLTPAGVYPGVELLANSIRFLPLQAERAGSLFEFNYRTGAILLFVMFAFFDWRFRPLIALFSTIAGTVALVAIAVGLFEDYSVFDVIETAILLALVYKALKMTFDFIVDVKEQRQHFPRGWRGALRTARAACLRDQH